MWIVVAYVIVLLRFVIVHCLLCVVVCCRSLLVLWCGVVGVVGVACCLLMLYAEVCCACVVRCVVLVSVG